MSNNRLKSSLAAAELMGEREMEYFGKSPYSLLDTIGEAVVHSFSRLESRFPTSLQAACPFLSERQVEAITASWLQLVESVIDRNFELFETYCLGNVFRLPAGLDFKENNTKLIQQTVIDAGFKLDGPANQEPVGEKEFSQLLLNFQRAKQEQQKLLLFSRQLGNYP